MKLKKLKPNQKMRGGEKMISKSFIVAFFVILFSVCSVFAITLNENGDFSVVIETQESIVFNDDINGEFTLEVNNNLVSSQDFEVVIFEQKGWDTEVNYKIFNLGVNKKKLITFSYSANSDFDYSTDVISPEEIIISQDDEYSGEFDLPIKVVGENEEVLVMFNVKIEKPDSVPIVFNPRFAVSDISPASPLDYTIEAKNIGEEISVNIRVELGEYEIANFDDTFLGSLNYKVYQTEIDSKIDPRQYEARIIIRYTEDDTNTAQEWFADSLINVVENRQISEIVETKSSSFEDVIMITITNNGNVFDTYVRDVELGFFERFLFSSSGSDDYEKTDKGIRFNIPLEKGETKSITCSINYLALYLLVLIVLCVTTYWYIRKSSNPLDVETEIYEVEKVEHEGVKSMKIKIGFENIKESEIDLLRIIFRMPGYLQVRDNSFLLTEPNHVMKGRNQFKLIWNLKRFEKNESRIIGFALVNKKGILGDIKIPDLEVEVKTHGKIRRYFHSFEVIKG